MGTVTTDGRLTKYLLIMGNIATDNFWITLVRGGERERPTVIPTSGSGQLIDPSQLLGNKHFSVQKLPQ